VSQPAQHHPPALGHTHRLLEEHRTWTLVTGGLALVAAVLALAGAYDLGAVVAVVSVLTGGWAMMISDNRVERFEVVSATVGGAVALAVCLAYGSGLSG
jgi:hypothetical protein